MRAERVQMNRKRDIATSDSTQEVEITPEMIDAGARVLMGASGLIDLSPTFAEIYSEQVLRAALRVSSDEKSQVASR
jgi:hypothetical protein